MTQTATYTMDSFIGDVREVFASTNDPLALEGINCYARVVGRKA